MSRPTSWRSAAEQKRVVPIAISATERAGDGTQEVEFDDGQDDAHCWECGLLHDECECHVGEECGRWRNGVLSGSLQLSGGRRQSSGTGG